MKELLFFLILIIFQEVLYSQKLISIRGKITDKQTAQVLPGATVTIKGSSISTVADDDGQFSFYKMDAGEIILVISYVGYETLELREIVPGNSNSIHVALSLDDRAGNEVVVAASKRAERITRAPASIQVIGLKDLQQFAGSNF